MRIYWNQPAYDDALNIADYIDIENPSAALAVCEEIHNQIGMLSDYPNMGRTGRVLGTRELVINRTAYIAVYRVQEQSITILRILHGAQMWPMKLLD